jgi:uncharacterized protein (DUF1501 family)
MTLSRRSLLSHASTAAFLGAVAPGLNVALAQSAPAADGNILVVLYLRGASDGLQMIAPAGDADYIANRPTIRVPSSGTGAGLGIATFDGVDFFLNPAVPELRDLYTSGKLALVHAVGIPNGDRSHFESQDTMELGAAPGEVEAGGGWLTRHLNALGGERPLLGTVAGAYNMPISLLGYTSGLAVPEVTTFNVSGGATTANHLRGITTGVSAYKQVAANTLDAISTIQSGLLTATNAPDAVYQGPIGSSLRSLARLIKMNVGVDLATVDQDGWDHHDNLVEEFGSRASDLSKSLWAFWHDLQDYQDRLTIVTMTEFGRRLQENESQGTDHGSASYMMAMGAGVKGGKIYGAWPGLKANQLRNGDLAVTTDYRRVLSEILVKRHGQTKIAEVFPTTAYNPLGLAT